VLVCSGLGAHASPSRLLCVIVTISAACIQAVFPCIIVYPSCRLCCHQVRRPTEVVRHFCIACIHSSSILYRSCSCHSSSILYQPFHSVSRATPHPFCIARSHFGARGALPASPFVWPLPFELLALARWCLRAQHSVASCRSPALRELLAAMLHRCNPLPLRPRTWTSRRSPAAPAAAASRL